MELKFNIGAGNKPIEGWQNIDLGDDINLFKVGGIDTIYTSHFLEYFDKSEVSELLRNWYRALKDNGILCISVPDFARVVEIYQNEGIIMDGALYGKMHAKLHEVDITNKDSVRRETILTIPREGERQYLYHKSTFDKKTLREALLLAGFRNVTEFEPFHDDCSKDPISLNLKCRK